MLKTKVNTWPVFKAQSSQSAKVFSSRRNWDSPTPSHAGECATPPVPGGGSRSLPGEGVGGGGFPIPTRGHTLWYSRYLYNVPYFEVQSLKEWRNLYSRLFVSHSSLKPVLPAFSCRSQNFGGRNMQYRVERKLDIHLD
jgi:hypothetical protein